MNWPDGWLPRQAGERFAPTAPAPRAPSPASQRPVAPVPQLRACCCPATPRVRVVLPVCGDGQDSRPPVDILLCAHHYRLNELRLVECGALHVSVIPGTGTENALLP